MWKSFKNASRHPQHAELNNFSYFWFGMQPIRLSLEHFIFIYQTWACWKKVASYSKCINKKLEENNYIILLFVTVTLGPWKSFKISTFSFKVRIQLVSLARSEETSKNWMRCCIFLQLYVWNWENKIKCKGNSEFFIFFMKIWHWNMKRRKFLSALIRWHPFVTHNA